MKLLPSQALLFPEASATQLATSALTRQVEAAVGSQCRHHPQSEPPWPCWHVDAGQSVRRNNHSVILESLQGLWGVLSPCQGCCPSRSRCGRRSDGYSICQKRLVVGSNQTEGRRRPLCQCKWRCVKDRGHFAHDQSRLNASLCAGAIGLATQRAALDDSPNLQKNGQSIVTQKLERRGHHSFAFLTLLDRWGESNHKQAAMEELEMETRLAAMEESVCGGTVAEQSKNSTLSGLNAVLLHGYQVPPTLVCISAGVLICCCLLVSPGSAIAEVADVSGNAAEWASLEVNAQQGLDLTWSLLGPLGTVLGLDLATEPSNALSLPTWVVHVSSVLEWVIAMTLVWKYGETPGRSAWKGMTWGMIPSLGGAMCACTWHFFYNAESLEILVATQSLLTLIGNCTLWFAAYRIFKQAQVE